MTSLLGGITVTIFFVVSVIVMAGITLPDSLFAAVLSSI